VDICKLILLITQYIGDARFCLLQTLAQSYCFPEFIIGYINTGDKKKVKWWPSKQPTNDLLSVANKINSFSWLRRGPTSSKQQTTNNLLPGLLYDFLIAIALIAPINSYSSSELLMWFKTCYRGSTDQLLKIRWRFSHIHREDEQSRRFSSILKLCRRFVH